MLWEMRIGSLPNAAAVILVALFSSSFAFSLPISMALIPFVVIMGQVTFALHCHSNVHHRVFILRLSYYCTEESTIQFPPF